MACEEQLKIPVKVSKNFWYKYENATATEWELKDDFYIVSFNLNNFPKSAAFKTDGEWIRTVSYLKPKRSMVCVHDFVKENYAGASIIETIFMETPASERYYVTIGRSSTDGADSTDAAGNNEKVSGDNLVLEFDSDCGFIKVK